MEETKERERRFCVDRMVRVTPETGVSEQGLAGGMEVSPVGGWLVKCSWPRGTGTEIMEDVPCVSLELQGASVTGAERAWRGEQQGQGSNRGLVMVLAVHPEASSQSVWSQGCE